MADSPLITKYRPTSWDEFVGNETALSALKRAISSTSKPHAYLFTGPSGIGKTTIARIVADVVGADVQEIDAASNNGVDSMRDLVEHGQHMSFTDSGARMLMIDECHTLTRPAWQAILKLLEEPPEHLYLALCTTELIKVPETIVTRCYHVPLKPISPPEMEDLLAAICGAEAWDVPADVIQLIVQGGTGQPRKALSILQSIHDAPSRDEARRIISLTEASDPMRDLLRYLISGGRDWKVVRTALMRLEDDSFEEASIHAGRYIAGALLNAESDKTAAKIWQLLEALMFPSETWDKKIAFITAVGRIMWGG